MSGSGFAQSVLKRSNTAGETERDPEDALRGAFFNGPLFR